MNHGSFFSGIGGFDLAAEEAGFKNIFHCEIEEDKRETLKRNFKNVLSYGDIREFEGQKYRDKIDVLSGGFPCQDISIAQTSIKLGGAQGIKGERSGLWKEYARVLGEIRPGAVVFENSPMLLIRGFEQVLCDFSKLGYDAEWRCFYASDFGLPHFRKRLYGVAYSKCKRWKNNNEKGGILQKILSTRSSRQKPVPISIERFNRNSSYADVRMDDGFSKELDKRLIHGFGNTIVPDIALQIFKNLIKTKAVQI
jgi:DNA (cytosine-5)-methyltransferase 1